MTENPVRRVYRSRDDRIGSPRLGHVVLGGLLVAVGTLWLVEAASDVDVPWEVVLPIALVLVGAALVYGASTGTHGGLMTLGVILSLLVILSSAFEVLLEGRFEGGRRRTEPCTARSGRYRVPARFRPNDSRSDSG